MRKKQGFNKTAVEFADILLPSAKVNPTLWATVACDQFSSEKDYWQKVESLVSNAPSTYNIILPECYLEKDNTCRINSINNAMKSYLDSDIFTEYRNSVILTRRSNSQGAFRYGIMVALDLEQYSFAKDSKSLIRATEGTILERIPPRVKIRQNAPIESPHIMVMINDDKKTIIEPLVKKSSEFKKVYDFDLMLSSGRLEGWLINDKKTLDELESRFVDLYNSSPKDIHGNKLLFAVGDGNHSLATAKQCWENLKSTLNHEEISTHPARYCLVEVENIYDPGIIFEPIHRVLFSIKIDEFDKKLSQIVGKFDKKTVSSASDCILAINADKNACYFGIYFNETYYVYKVQKSEKLSTSAKVIEALIEDVVYKEHIADVDYIHEVENTIKVCKNADNVSQDSCNIAIIMSDIKKEEFFPTILNVGTFPRKTFSIGSATEKRFYMECRKIRP